MYFKVNRLKIECACQMLICLSTCDYLLDHLFKTFIFGFQNMTEYLCENNNQFNTKIGKKSTNKNHLDCLIENSIILLDSFDFILNIRCLDNYTKISTCTRDELLKFLNSIFIQLTEYYPLLAIKMAKTIQLLNLKIK